MKTAANHQTFFSFISLLQQPYLKVTFSIELEYRSYINVLGYGRRFHFLHFLSSHMAAGLNPSKWQYKRACLWGLVFRRAVLGDLIQMLSNWNRDTQESPEHSERKAGEQRWRFGSVSLFGHGFHSPHTDRQKTDRPCRNEPLINHQWIHQWKMWPTLPSQVMK